MQENSWWIRRKFWALCCIGLLSILSFNFWLSATGQDVSEDSDTVELAALSIPFNPETDQQSVLPLERGISNNPLGDTRVLIGADDRIPVVSRAFPWSTIGRLEIVFETQMGVLQSTCTATLIGPNLLLTNAHCLKEPVGIDRATQGIIREFINPEDYETVGPKFVFRPSMIEGTALDAATVVSYEAGWRRGQTASADDWALLTIDKPLGDTDRYGHMGWRDIDFRLPENQEQSFEAVKVAGYSGDFPTEELREFGSAAETAGADLACSIVEVVPDDSDLANIAQADEAVTDVLVHDCDANRGGSGSPMFAYFEDGGYAIVGLHAGSAPVNFVESSDGVETNFLNVGVEVSRWAGIAREILAREEE